MRLGRQRAALVMHTLTLPRAIGRVRPATLPTPRQFAANRAWCAARQHSNPTLAAAAQILRENHRTLCAIQMLPLPAHRNPQAKKPIVLRFMSECEGF